MQNVRAATVASVNIGRAEPSEYASPGMTGIGKQPVIGPVEVTAPGPRGTGGSGLTGDAICDLVHHGGDDQAVYAYATEDLATWSADLGRELPPGIFGENLTTAGLDLNACVVGEIWRVGSDLVLQVSDPRIPCRTFAGHLQEHSWVRRFTQRGLSGTYLRVIEPGPVEVGMTIDVEQQPSHGVTVGTAFRAMTVDPTLLPTLVDAVGLSAKVRAKAAARTKRTKSAPPG